jgi:hypothetical protein
MPDFGRCMEGPVIYSSRRSSVGIDDVCGESMWMTRFDLYP